MRSHLSLNYKTLQFIEVNAITQGVALEAIANISYCPHNEPINKVNLLIIDWLVDML